MTFLFSLYQAVTLWACFSTVRDRGLCHKSNGKSIFFEGMYFDNKEQVGMKAWRSVFEGQEISCLFPLSEKNKKQNTHSKQREQGVRGKKFIEYSLTSA